MLPHDVRFQALRAEVGLLASPDESRRDAALAALAGLRAASDMSAHDRFARAFVRRDEAMLAVIASRAKRLAADDRDGARALVLGPVTAELPTAPWYLEQAASVLRECGDPDGADALSARALLLRGEERLAAGDAEGARRSAVRAFERDPANPRVRELETLALLRLGQTDAAREAFAAAVAAGLRDASRVRSGLESAGLAADPAWNALLDRLSKDGPTHPRLSPLPGDRR
ncbi:MAG: hypothetical protein HMLKMBBP_00212 [Planctomycetes bacterium]|nr:hypothetical protein [Planctomycetota bacterium]